jgi:hypothetical protein
MVGRRPSAWKTFEDGAAERKLRISESVFSAAAIDSMVAAGGLKRPFGLVVVTNQPQIFSRKL